MNKEKLYNFAISKLSNKKISNAQKATVRQLVDAGVICNHGNYREYDEKYIRQFSSTVNAWGLNEDKFASGGYTDEIGDKFKNAIKIPVMPCETKREKPECNQSGLGWWAVFTAAFLGSLAVEIASLCW